MSIDAPTQPLHKRPALTGSQVKRLRESYAAGIERRLLCKRFGISRDTMRRYLSRKLDGVNLKEESKWTAKHKK